VAVVIAYLGGEHGRDRLTVRHGVAQVGLNQASVKVGGWWYGINASVPWVDDTNSWHESGWPTCLAPVGSAVAITFGEITVTGPDGQSWRQVAWVDCRS
jgi:hypothetical protein